MNERCPKVGPVVKRRLVVLKPIEGFTVEKTTDEVFQFTVVCETLHVKNVGDVREPTCRILRVHSCEWLDVVDLRLENQVSVRHVRW